MRKHLLQYFARLVVVSAWLGTTTSSTPAGSFTRGCAARDLQILMLIEERENTNVVPAEKLSDALLLMLEARIVCYEGRVTDAIALYDSIARSVEPDMFLSARRKH